MADPNFFAAPDSREPSVFSLSRLAIASFLPAVLCRIGAVRQTSEVRSMRSSRTASRVQILTTTPCPESRVLRTKKSVAIIASTGAALAARRIGVNE